MSPSSDGPGVLLQGWPGEDGELGLGRAVGPEWTESLAAFGASSSAGLQVEYNCEVSALVRPLQPALQLWLLCAASCGCVGHLKLESVVCEASEVAPMSMCAGCSGGTAAAQVDASESPEDDAGQWPLHVRLSNGAVHGVDFVVSATGVTPSTAWLPADLQRNPGSVPMLALP